METMFLGIVVFLFLLAIFDLVVGVSNDAVNFMNSAIGAKAASFKTIIAIAALWYLYWRHTEQWYDGHRTSRYLPP